MNKLEELQSKLISDEECKTYYQLRELDSLASLFEKAANDTRKEIEDLTA